MFAQLNEVDRHIFWLTSENFCVLGGRFLIVMSRNRKMSVFRNISLLVLKPTLRGWSKSNNWLFIRDVGKCLMGWYIGCYKLRVIMHRKMSALPPSHLVIGLSIECWVSYVTKSVWYSDSGKFQGFMGTPPSDRNSASFPIYTWPRFVHRFLAVNWFTGMLFSVLHPGRMETLVFL